MISNLLGFRVLIYVSYYLHNFGFIIIYDETEFFGFSFSFIKSLSYVLYFDLIWLYRLHKKALCGFNVFRTN
jgi:hypothetical protein